MPTVEVALGERSYPVVIESGLLQGAVARETERLSATGGALVTDSNVGPLYAERACSGSSAPVVTIPPGEAEKSFAGLESLLRKLLQSGLDRKGCVFALGGGVVGDLAGFAAAVYMRGVDYVQLPTTLLAQVDSSVGGKTAVNLPEGKNLAGAFHQPRRVCVDPAVLQTLPGREFRAGLAEVAKYAVLDCRMTELLEGALPIERSSPALGAIIRLSCEIKARVVSADEREGGERAVLNFGHTAGHAIETEAGGELLHGEAVARGMAVAGRLALRLGMWKEAEHERMMSLLSLLGLETEPGFDARRVAESIAYDKKKRARRTNWVLPVRLGELVVRDDVPRELVIQALGGE